MTAPDDFTKLEAAVRRASGEISRLRKENEGLKKHVPSVTALAAWERERDELRGRVQRLVDQLESLLAEAGTDS
jgi:hypothetical protein